MTNKERKKLFTRFLNYYASIMKGVDTAYTLFLFNAGIHLGEVKDTYLIDHCLKFIDMFNTDRQGIISCFHLILYKNDYDKDDEMFLIEQTGRQILNLLASLVDDIERDEFKDVPYRKELISAITQQFQQLSKYVLRHITPLAREKS